MNLRRLILLALLATNLLAQAQRTYKYEQVPNDPMDVRIYTLDNGLKVYLSRNNDAPRVQTHIAVRAGSKFDPADATGLAHYLEHMLFKGTSKIGTKDWPAEQAILKQISDLYERNRSTTDESKREANYRAIDSLSYLAAKLAIPNEYDRMISSIGAQGTNAYTSTEQTVYINDIPSNEIEKWMKVEAERMQELVLRLFHTEMETVYEEFNRSQDNDYRTVFKAKDELLYPSHPYGTQTTIGTGEHLKNPSMVKIHEYFDTYYVPNNMAIIMAGDIDHDATIAMVDRYFGGWKRKPVPTFTFEPQAIIEQPRQREVFGPMGEWVQLAWRLDGAKSNDAIMIDLISGILSNGKAGLIDLNLDQRQRVLDPSAYAYSQIDYSELGMSAKPRQGQSLDEVRDLLLQQVEQLKSGEFDDWLIEAVVNNKRQRRMRAWRENNRARASVLTSVFIQEKDWKDEIGYLDRMAKVTKQQVMDFAKANFRDSHVCIYKRTGVNPDNHKVSKPRITPIEINRDDRTAFHEEFLAMPSARLKPEFVDFGKSIDREKLRNGVELAHIANTSDDLFSLYQVMDLGTYNDPRLGLAMEYLPYLGTSKHSAEDLRKEFFRLGLDFNVFVQQDRMYIALSGLDANMERGVELMEHILADAQPDAAALENLVKDVLKSRSDALKNKGAISAAMFNHARYGERSPFKEVLSTEELQALRPEELITFIRELNDHQHRMFYYGKRESKAVVTMLDKMRRMPATLRTYPQPAPYVEQETSTNKVYVVDHDMVQNEIMLVSKGGNFDATLIPYAVLFSEYFGSGLSSIVFQEIREAKALAYSAGAFFTVPGKADEAHYLRASVGTQSDKLGDAVSAILALMNDMPANAAMFNASRDAAMKKIESRRVTRESIYWNWETARRRGVEHDLDKDTYERMPAIGLAEMKDFFDQNVKGRNFTYMVIGRVADMDMDALKALGPVEQLSHMQLFGYDDPLKEPK